MLVNCSYGECPEGRPIIQAGWVYTYGLLAPVERLTADDGAVVQVITQDWMQADRNGGELYDANDTCDFYLANE